MYQWLKNSTLPQFLQVHQAAKLTGPALASANTRRLAQLLDVLQVALSRDNDSCSLEYEVVDLACNHKHQSRKAMLDASDGDDTIPQLHVRTNSGEMLCICSIHRVEEMHDFGARFSLRFSVLVAC